MKLVRHLAAAFPRASWRQDSDAAYAMALMNAGVTSDELGPAVADLVAEADNLPTVAEILAAVRRRRRADTVEALRCPACGSALIAVSESRVILCFDCDWECDE